MGGFTVNGFGATDRFVPIRNLGTFQCPHCKQERMLQLMEVQRKVSLLYIQTVTINTKYAIACASCQNGYYIEEQQKDDILYGRAIATITEQGAVLLKKEKIIDAPEKQEKPSLPQNSQAERPRRRFCGRCGSSLDGQTGRCPVCDGEGNTKEIEAEELYVEGGLEHMDFTLRTGTESRTVTAAGNISTAADAGAAANAGAAQSLAGKLSRKICPSCSLLFSSDKTTCPVCGSGLEDRK